MDFLVHHLLRAGLNKAPEKEALVHREERLSYREVENLSNCLANGLMEAGLKRGDRVGIFLGKSINEVVGIFATAKSGGVFVPINHLLFPDQVKHILNDCGVRGIITSVSKLDSIQTVLPEVPSVEFVIVTDGAQSGGYPRISLTLNNILAKCSNTAPKDLRISQDLAAILYTSGSTGRPKGVMLSHANLIAGSRIVSSYLHVSEKDRILSILPFSFDYGLNQLLTAFQEGGTLILLNFKFANEIVQALLKERITGLAGVPPLWSLLTQPSSSLHRHQFPFLRYITNSGGAMPQTVLASLRKTLTSTQIYLMYGLTEAFRSTYLPPEELDKRPMSFGKAIPDTEIFVVNEKNELCRPGEVGELVHRGPTVSLGYWGQPEVTAKVLRPNPFLPPELQHTEMVCYSGDMVKMDEEGFLYYVSRRDTTIKSSGFRISPTEVEEILFQTGKLREAAVVGVPDEVLGQAVKAFIVPHDGEAPDVESLLGFCAEKMPQYMVPKSIEILNELPKTTSGKIDYPTLRRREPR
jgi:acyl-CoA ligase (AMP-forming) (exosortase A-associated)